MVVPRGLLILRLVITNHGGGFSSTSPTLASKQITHRAVLCTHLLLAGSSAPERLPRGLACLTVRLHPTRALSEPQCAPCATSKAATWAARW